MNARALLLTALSLPTVFAQTPSASVVGRVTDATGAVIPGVAVRITNLDTNIGQNGSSNAVGEFTIPYLNPGRYALEASSTGFRTHKRGEFTLEVEQVLRLDIPLEIGSASESVTVSDAPPVLNTETAARGEVTTQDEIREMPLDGRNFSDLALLSGGVIPKGDGSDGSYAVNGARADNTGFLLDGMNNTQRRNTGAVMNPPLEGVQEFKMLTSGFSAEYGRYAGGMLTVVTKSGANRLRGALYEFLRNDVLDANGYFDPGKGKLRRNQFGATVSGPVYLPKLYDGRNRTFFMFTWDSLRLIDGQSQRGVAPTPEMLRGDFSKATDSFGKPIKLTDTINKVPFPNNQIPASRLNPVAAKLGAYYPQPNLAGGTVYNYVAQGNATVSFNNLGIKVDHTLSSKDRLTLSAFWRPNSDWDPVNVNKSPVPFFGSTNRTLELLTYIRYLRTIAPAMFLEASVNFSRRTNNEVWPYSADKNWANETGFAGGTTNPVAAGPPFLSVTGYIPLGPNNVIPKIWAFNNYQYAASTTWIKGLHSLKFGGDFLRAQYFSRNYGDTRGRANFLGRFTGDPLADFVLGWADSTRRQLDGSGPYHLMSNYSAFLQDDFRVTPALTINLGVRYDVMKPPREKYGAWAVFLPSLGKVVTAGTGTYSQAEFDQRIAAVGLSPYVVKASEVGLPATVTRTDWTNIAPRFGFAWRIFGNTRTVLRGGYGIFYGSSSLYRMDNYSDTYPFAITETYSRVTADPTVLTLSNPFPASRRGFSGVNGSYGEQSAEPQSQYIQSWNLAVEREFGHGTVLEAAFAGSKGTHLPRRYDVNQAGRDPANRTLRPYPFFGGIEMISDGSNSIYNSGQVTLRRRFSKQLFVRGTYTYAKSIDETSNTGGTIAYNFAIAQDSRNLKLDRGRSDFDVGHAFAGSFIWSPQYSRHWLARDWQVSGTSTIYTGPPFTPRVANFSYVNGEASRPDRIRTGRVEKPSPDHWFERAAFVPVPLNAYRFGNSGRNILDGPGAIVINTSISRRLRFAENRAIQFRMEAFNLPNHPNFNLPENNVDVATAGTINTAKNNRNLQMGLRLEF
jgi:hypothetical protein